MSAIFADPTTGEIDHRFASDAAHECADAAVAFFDAEWERVKATFDITEKEALGLTLKNVNAAVNAMIRSHHDILAEEFGPRQTKLGGM